MEETVQQTVDGERQRETETREPDVVDVITADLNIHHKGSADKQKYSTIGYQRRTKQKVVTDFATLSKGTSAGAKPRTALKQVLFSQGVSDKASEERSQLDGLKQVLEAYSLPVDLRWRWNEESQGTTLESSWTDIVQSHSTMSKMQRHQQEALWEFVHTELTYINKLLFIRDLVIASLVRLHQKGFLLEVTPEQLFFNLPSIVEEHQLFWQEVVYPMLQEARKTAKPFDPMRLEPGCLQFHYRFSSYHDYCWEEENNLEFSRRQMESNPHFSTYVQWVQNHPQGYRMRLGDMQAKPHQRITKYPLLLKAVLKHTQDPHVQRTLRGMLSSVNDFLEGINDYLRQKDDKLALNISAQRLEGYEVDGLNEEIDRNVREICHFDLECPIKGVGHGVIRKLLLEENLKVRGRKDSKLELVALLFSDVLLLTKVQKKTERLKVVRPPLALDRMYCKPLKDGCSFLLVEVGELQSPMNVLILVASASDSCSSWVSTIYRAKETLRQLRETERKRLETLKLNQQAKNPVKDAMTDDVETEEQPVAQPGMETSMDESTDDTFISNTINGLAGPEQYQSPEEMDTDKTESRFWYTEPTNPLIVTPTNKRKIGSKRSALKPPAFMGPEWIEMEMRQDQGGNQWEDEDKIVESQITDKLNVTLRQRVQSAPTLDSFSHTSAAQPFRRNTVRPYSFLPGELPDVDYPTDEGDILPNNQPIIMKEPELLRQQSQQEILTRKNSDSLSANQETRRNSSGGLFPDTRTPQQAWVSRNLKSPGIQRRRPVSTNPATFRTSKEFFQSLEQTGAASDNYSSSNLDSNHNPKLKRNSVPTNMSYQFNPVKSNQDMFWNNRVFSDPRAFSESELPDTKFENKKPKIKTHRSSSVSNMKPKGKARLRPPSSSLHTPTQAEDEHSSRLEGLLERAKYRERGRGALIKDRNLKTTNLRSRYPSPSPSFSPPRSDGDTDLEEVEVTRSKAPSVSQRWKEQLVDGDEDEPGNSVFVDGENVDWSGWCFDDDEVNDRLRPSKNGFLEEFNRSLALYGIGELSEQEDGECSQV